GHNLTVEVENLRLQRPQLGAESKEAGAGNVRQPFVAYIGDHIEQFFNAIASDRCDDAKLGKMAKVLDRQLLRALHYLDWIKLNRRGGDRTPQGRTRDPGTRE